MLKRRIGCDEDSITKASVRGDLAKGGILSIIKRFRSPWRSISVGDEKLSPAAFLTKVGLDYSVEKTPVLDRRPNGDIVTVENQFNLRRTSDHVIVSPRSVSRLYGPTDPRMLVENVCRTFYDAGYASFDSGWTSPDGTKETLGMRLDFGEENRILENPLPADEWANFLTIKNCHGGTGGISFEIVRNRTICMNGAMLTDCRGRIKLSHRGDVPLKLVEAQATWSECRAIIAAHNAKLAKLAFIDCDVEAVVESLLGIPKIKASGDKVSTQIETKAERITSYARRADLGAYGKTLYDVLNGITAFNTHDNWSIGKNGDALHTMFESARARESSRMIESLEAMIA